MTMLAQLTLDLAERADLRGRSSNYQQALTCCLSYMGSITQLTEVFNSLTIGQTLGYKGFA